MTKFLSLKSKLGSAFVLCSICFFVSNVNAVDVAKGASVAKSVASTVRVTNTASPSTVGKGIVASIVSNGRGSSNLELDTKKDNSANKTTSTSQATLTLCGGQLIEGLCLGGGFLPGRFVPPTVTTTVP